jgi:hypothetical protein
MSQVKCFDCRFAFRLVPQLYYEVPAPQRELIPAYFDTKIFKYENTFNFGFVFSIRVSVTVNPIRTIKNEVIQNMQAGISDFFKEYIGWKIFRGFWGLFHVFGGYFRGWTSSKVKNIQPGPQMMIFLMVRRYCNRVSIGV